MQSLAVRRGIDAGLDHRRPAVRERTLNGEAIYELDRDALVKRLSEAGYLRVPVVEDPGSFAVRGALVDVWPPRADSPSRAQLYGDTGLSITPFDPHDMKFH